MMLDVHPTANFPGMEVVDCIDLPILILDLDLTVAGFNAAAATMLSLTRSDYGRHINSIRTLTGRPKLEELCGHVIASETSHRVELADEAGSRFSVSIGCHKRDLKVDGAVLTFTNVTAFRESLERAIEEREYTKAVINTIADALVIVDSDLRIQSANQAFYALFQTSRENSQRARFYQLGNGNWDVDWLRKLLDGSSPSNGNPESLECDHEHSSMGCRTLLLNARRLIRGSHDGQTTLITIQDITERKASEEARRRLAAIVESSEDAIASKGLNGIVTSWNRAAEKMFGYTAKEMIGGPITTIIPPDLQDDEKRILETIARGERIERFETVRLTKNGERIDVSLTISPVRDEAGTVIGAAKIARDITKEKKTEQALRTTEKLASVGRMAATVAHEINNPLEAVTNLMYLAKGCALDEDARNYLATMEEELDRISQLTKQTLGFYRETKAPSAIKSRANVGPANLCLGCACAKQGNRDSPRNSAGSRDLCRSGRNSPGDHQSCKQ
jgi:two-component system, chemotaxis family, CheB/CheR fusion protein